MKSREDGRGGAYCKSCGSTRPASWDECHICQLRGEKDDEGGGTDR